MTDTPPLPAATEALHARQDELRALGNVYAECREAPPAELTEEYRRIAEELARRAKAPSGRKAG